MNVLNKDWKTLMKQLSDNEEKSKRIVTNKITKEDTNKYTTNSNI